MASPLQALTLRFHDVGEVVLGVAAGAQQAVYFVQKDDGGGQLGRLQAYDNKWANT